MAKRKFIPEIIQAHLETFASQGLVPLFEQGVAIQEAVLEDIIRLSSKSWYAKDHGFFGIQNKEEFFAKVPISDYGDYAPYVESNMQRDEGQVSEAETAYYLLSTGRKKQGKYYIETALGSQARQLSIHLWNINLMRCEPKMTQPDVKMLAVTNCAPIEHAPNGKNVRRTSSQAAKELWEETPELYIFPYEFLEADMSNDDRDYLTALYALKEKHLNMLFCNNLGYFGVILDIIEKNAERLISDIAEGRMSVALKPEDRQQLEGMLGADPARAEQLRRLLWERGRLVAEDIWPDFFFTGAWLAGTVGDYARDVMAKLPASMRYISESYGCSEGMLNIPLAYNAKYGPLAVYSCYFEFLPLKNIMGGGNPLSMQEIEDGGYYELLISTYSGLYRYNLHDIVRVCGYTGDTPNIEFCCRSSETIRIGEKFWYGFELSNMIKNVEADCHVTFDFYQALVEEEQLSLIVELRQEDAIMAVWRDLCRVAAEKQMPLDKIYWVNSDYRNHLYRGMMDHGRTIQCIKLPMLSQEVPTNAYVEAIYDAKREVRPCQK